MMNRVIVGKVVDQEVKVEMIAVIMVVKNENITVRVVRDDAVVEATVVSEVEVMMTP